MNFCPGLECPKGSKPLENPESCEIASEVLKVKCFPMGFFLNREVLGWFVLWGLKPCFCWLFHALVKKKILLEFHSSHENCEKDNIKKTTSNMMDDLQKDKETY